jgi:hypothetical protein
MGMLSTTACGRRGKRWPFVTPVQVMNTAIATNWHVAAAHTKA